MHMKEDLEGSMEKKVRTENLLNFDMCSPSTYISISRVWKLYYKYLNTHLSQADA